MDLGRSIRTIVAVGLGLSAGFAQSLRPPTTPEVFRTQADSLAADMVSHIQLDPPGRVAVFVEGAGQRVVVENAMLDMLQRRGISAWLYDSTAFAGAVLRVVVLEQRADERAVSDTTALRTASTRLEARLEQPGRAVQMLGMYRRTTVDTVDALTVRGPETDEPSVISKLLIPLVMLGSAVLMVYLFFTVRS